MNLSRRLKCTIVIMRCPSSVVRPSTLTFHILDFSSETTDQNSTKLDSKRDLNVLYQVCVFRAARKNKMATLSSDWLRHFRLFLWIVWTEFSETCQEARSQCPLPSLHFVGRSEKQDGRPGLWFAETFSTLLFWNCWKGIQRNLTGSKITTSSTKFVFFGPIGKQDGRPGLGLAETFSTSPLKPLNGMSTKLDRKQDLNVLYQVCVFSCRSENKMAARPLIGWDIFDFFSETAERNSVKLNWKQDLNILYQVCVFRPIGKTRWPLCPIRQKGSTLCSGARYVALWASCLITLFG